MPDTGVGPKNKLELESQVLCSALRQSWASKDSEGAATSARELYQLFPDLLPPPKLQTDLDPQNYYESLKIDPQASNNRTITAFLKAARKFLRTKLPPESKPESQEESRKNYQRLLDAGFILRKPRLRLSHDLVVVRWWLIQSQTIPEDGTLELPASGDKPTEAQLLSTQPIILELPRMIQLLREANVIGPAEVQALSAQMSLAPEVPLERLILDSGYVTPAEMNSLRLAEMLLNEDKITMAQFQVAIYDERTSGIRMAESLQVRGWLSVEVRVPPEDQS